MCHPGIDENEFGPLHDLESIFLESLDLPYHQEENMKRWKRRHNHFVEVMRRKRERQEMESNVDKADKEES